VGQEVAANDLGERHPPLSKLSNCTKIVFQDLVTMVHWKVLKSNLQKLITTMPFVAITNLGWTSRIESYKILSWSSFMKQGETTTMHSQVAIFSFAIKIWRGDICHPSNWTDQQFVILKIEIKIENMKNLWFPVPKTLWTSYYAYFCSNSNNFLSLTLRKTNLLNPIKF